MVAAGVLNLRRVFATQPTKIAIHSKLLLPRSQFCWYHNRREPLTVSEPANVPR